MNRQPGFEKLYAKMHDIDPEDLVQYRFGSKDGYRLPQMASHYRLYCETLDSLVVTLPDTSVDLQDSDAWFNSGVEKCRAAIETAGIKVAP